MGHCEGWCQARWLAADQRLQVARSVRAVQGWTIALPGSLALIKNSSAEGRAGLEHSLEGMPPPRCCGGGCGARSSPPCPVAASVAHFSVTAGADHGSLQAQASEGSSRNPLPLPSSQRCAVDPPVPAGRLKQPRSRRPLLRHRQTTARRLQAMISAVCWTGTAKGQQWHQRGIREVEAEGAPGAEADERQGCGVPQLGACVAALEHPSKQSCLIC